MHQPGYIQEGQGDIIGCLLLGNYHRRIPGDTDVFLDGEGLAAGNFNREFTRSHTRDLPAVAVPLVFLVFTLCKRSETSLGGITFLY
jgi:hypothetical protein